MKKYILTLAAIALSFSFANAQNLYIDEVVEVPQGAIGKVAVKYETGGYELKALQLKLDLPAGITVGTNSDDETYEILDAKASKFSVTYANNGWNAFSASTAFSADTEGKGTFMNIFLAADASLGIGTTHEVTVKGPMVSRVVDGASQAYYLDDFTFTVKIVENRVVLDENSTTLPEAAENVNVKVQRTIKGGNWSTICLPFAMTAEQISSAFGEAQIAEFTGCVPTYASDADQYAESITVNFSSASTMEANHPYLIKVSDDIAEFNVDGVNIAPATNVDDLTLALDETKVSRTLFHYNYFIGNYIAGTPVEAGSVIISGNKFYVTKGTTIKAFRGYFFFEVDVIADMISAGLSNVKMNIDGDATSIEAINGEPNNDGIYDMSGRKLNEMPKTKGVYVIDGKKVAIK